MKKSRLARRTRLKNRKALQRGTARLNRGKALRAKKRLRKSNPKRRAKLYEIQFGTKGDDMKGLPCWVTGTPVDPDGYWTIENAHVGSPDPDARKRTRGAGADNTFIARLRHDVHRSFDEDPDDVFLNRWQSTKQWVREKAAEFDAWYRGQVASTPTQQERPGAAK